MTVYPGAIDDDRTIIRIDDNLAQLGTQAINQLREAVFAIETELGLQPSGSAGTLASRIDKSLTADGDIKTSALTSVGLATLPIDNSEIGANAGIQESKLTLNHGTTDLYTQITANSALLNSTAAFATTINSDLRIHIAGGSVLSDGSTPGRHVGSQIDLNDVPSDSRDPSYIWGGLQDKDGNNRTATSVNSALDQINTSLITHENATTPVHPATAVSVDTDEFTEIPSDATNAQLAFDAIDNADRLNIGEHRAVMHDNGVPRTARSELISGPDGYSQNIVPITPCNAFLVRPPATSPVDSNTNGDDLVVFNPDNTGKVFDTQFTQVKVGDIIRINYGNGIEGRFPIESIRYEPGTSWVVRLNGNNITNTDGYDAYARIDRPLFDDNTYGVFACAAANNDINSGIINSIIVGNPRGATALGIGFDPNQLDSSHYLLYLNLYPTGNPSDRTIQMPGIDVTGDGGASPGHYTIDNVVQATNNALRAAGYNYRFIAFNHKGEFGIMLGDTVDGASFSIINGIISGGALSAGSFSSNVIADADTLSGYDALGLGRAKAGLASPDISSYSSSEAASNFPTLILPPLKSRNAVVDGVRRDTFIETYAIEGDGYWIAEVTDVNLIGSSTVEIEYTVSADLCQAELKVGKTILVQPTIPYSDSSNLNVDYGRYFIKEVSFTPSCGGTPGTTVIRVVNGVHGTTNPISTPSDGIIVRLYFGEDAVSFNETNVVDPSPTPSNYNRLHEIYLDAQGHTFSHERARMIRQAQSSDLLATQDNWTVTNVSSKLSGFRDGTTDFRKYVRFYVLNYNTPGGGGTGEYDGYIGRRNPGTYGITEFGEVVRARKGVPTKFYDATNVDYIELVFDDPGPTSTDIMTSNSPRYVDIEVFPSLELDDEVFLLATCELESNAIERVVDRREFGTVSEKNLSTSALSFIESGDRYLHGNGVIRGLEYQGPDPSDPSLLSFTGGLALVNGHVSILNNSQVRIPEIRETGSSTPVSYDWAVCINDKDQFVPILLTSSKQEFFALGSPDYYVDSATFTELINNRKDLTPTVVVTVTISSMSVGSVTDVRRRIADETLSIPFTLSQPKSSPYTGTGEEGFVGHFSTLSALLYWINNSDDINSFVRVRGEITSSAVTISSPVFFDGGGTGKLVINGRLTTTADLTFDNIEVEIQGDQLRSSAAIVFTNCTLSFTNSAGGLASGSSSGKWVFNNSTLDFEDSAGIVSTGYVGTIVARDSTINTADGVLNCLFSSRYNFDNCAFTFASTDMGFDLLGNGEFVLTNSTVVWEPVGTPSNNFMDVSGGAIHLGSGSTARIENVVFQSSTDPRFPFISGEITGTGRIDSLCIKDCVFQDNGSAVTIGRSGAIAIVGTSTSGKGVIANALIEGNICREVQGIYLTGNENSDGGLTAINCSVVNNNCGPIGYYVRSYEGQNLAVRGNKGAKPSSLLIQGNSAGAIVTINDSGGQANPPSLPTGNVLIKDNITHTIYGDVSYGTETNFNEQGSLQIIGNTVETTELDVNVYPSSAIAANANGIRVGQYGDGPDSVLITNNIIRAGNIDRGSVEDIYTVTYGIFVLDGQSIISENSISGFESYGIYVPSGDESNIINNHLNRESREITAYIEANGDSIIIKDNGATDYDVIVSSNPQSLISGNRNHRQSIKLTSCRGNFAASSVGMDIEAVPETAQDAGSLLWYVVKITYTGGTGARNAAWEIPLSGMPKGTKVVRVKTRWSTNINGVDVDDGDMVLKLIYGDFLSAPTTDAKTITIGGSGSISANNIYDLEMTLGSGAGFITGDARRDDTNDVFVSVGVEGIDDATGMIFYIRALEVEYVW
jgi:hypothetical protein